MPPANSSSPPTRLRKVKASWTLPSGRPQSCGLSWRSTNATPTRQHTSIGLVLEPDHWDGETVNREPSKCTERIWTNPGPGPDRHRSQHRRHPRGRPPRRRIRAQRLGRRTPLRGFTPSSGWRCPRQARSRCCTCPGVRFLETSSGRSWRSLTDPVPEPLFTCDGIKLM
jgi:hypothetical protein